MAITVAASGSQLATVGTGIQALTTIGGAGAAGIYEFRIDASVLTDTDRLEIFCEAIVIAGGALRYHLYDDWIGARPGFDQTMGFLPVTNPFTDASSLRFSMRQPNGTARTFAWAVYKHA